MFIYIYGCVLRVGDHLIYGWFGPGPVTPFMLKMVVYLPRVPFGLVLCTAMCSGYNRVVIVPEGKAQGETADVVRGGNKCWVHHGYGYQLVW